MILVQISFTERDQFQRRSKKCCTATACTKCIRRKWKRWGKWGRCPGPIVSDVVSVKTLSTRVEASLDELMSAELVSMMRQSRCPMSWSRWSAGVDEVRRQKVTDVPAVSLSPLSWVCIVTSLPVRRWKRFRKKVISIIEISEYLYSH